MKNKDALDKIYLNLDNLMEDYEDLEETEEAESGFWEYVKQNIMDSREEINEKELEDVLYDVSYFRERQGFMYGFNYALRLLGKPNP